MQSVAVNKIDGSANFVFVFTPLYVSYLDSTIFWFQFCDGKCEIRLNQVDELVGWVIHHREKRIITAKKFLSPHHRECSKDTQDYHCQRSSEPSLLDEILVERQ